VESARRRRRINRCLAFFFPVAAVHYRALDRSCFIQDPLEQAANRRVRKRPGIRVNHAIEHLFLPIRLVERLAGCRLDPPDFYNAARALVQLLDEPPVDLIDFAAPVFYAHA
jgi:hypothetical protein